MRIANRNRGLRAIAGGVVAVIIGAACVGALAQNNDPKRSPSHQPRPGPTPSGPVSVPTYSPPIGAYPSAPINQAPPAAQHPRGGDRHHQGPIVIAPTVGLPVSPTFGSGPVGVDGSHYAYYCPDFGAYYPHVAHCPSAWVIVAAQPGQRWR